MGGHNHHHAIPKVPDPSIYKVEDAPELVKLREKLAAKGLKDPWIRNQVWRFTFADKNPRANWILRDLFTYGWKFWVPMVAITIGVETFLGIDYHPHGHGHGHGHDEAHGEEH